jgi:Vitamin K-dependent gamma-carboxylase.
VEPLPALGMYAVHILLAMSSLAVMLGWKYRLAAVAQFVLFTYTELIDLTYYLNHYYFVSIVCGLLVFVPANRACSLDVWSRPALQLSQVPRWAVFIFQLQLGIVYFYAGIWKINADWLLHALPLKIWVPANDQLPLIGWMFRHEITPWLFSWAGMLYDVSIVFWLSWAPTRP